MGEQRSNSTKPRTLATTIIIQTVSTDPKRQQSEVQVRLQKTNQIFIEQPKGAALQHIKAKLLHEEYSESILQQDAEYRHYANILEQIVVKEDILRRNYFDETGKVKYHQTLLPQHLFQKLLQSLHERVQRHLGLSKMLQDITQKFCYSSIATHVKKWVEGCQQCA